MYGPDAENLDAKQFQQFVSDVEAGRQQVKIDQVFRFNEIVEAHRYMEGDRASGKLVVLVDK